VLLTERKLKLLIKEAVIRKVTVDDEGVVRLDGYEILSDDHPLHIKNLEKGYYESALDIDSYINNNIDYGAGEDAVLYTADDLEQIQGRRSLLDRIRDRSRPESFDLDFSDDLQLVSSDPNILNQQPADDATDPYVFVGGDERVLSDVESTYDPRPRKRGKLVTHQIPPGEELTSDASDMKSSYLDTGVLDPSLFGVENSEQSDIFDQSLIYSKEL
jgi:hypothetical protein